MQYTPQKLVLCGPQITSAPPEKLVELQKTLAKHTSLWQALSQVVDDLPALFQHIVKEDDFLGHVKAAEQLSVLNDWIKTGSSDVAVGSAANLVSLPWTVLLQLSMYLEYLDSKGAQVHDNTSALRDHGVQGFCAGFLTASAIASSQDEAALASHAATSIRLAMSIGAYIDADIAALKSSAPASVLSARWKSGSLTLDAVSSTVSKHRHAYISCITDETCVTITTLASGQDALVKDLEQSGLKVKKVGITGRFHSPNLHSAAARKLGKVVSTTSTLQLPTADRLRAPLRSNGNGLLISGNVSISEEAIRTILLQTADWYSTVSSSLGSVDSSSAPEFVTLSFDDSIVPLSLAQRVGLANGHAQGSKSGISTPTSAVADGPLDGHGLFSGNAADYPAHSVAVVGMAGRFPGAKDMEAFWELLKTAEPMVRQVPEDRLNLKGQRMGDKSDSKFWGNFIDDADSFDHRFFKKSSREAISWDPEKRILLEVVYEALESAGHFGPSGGDKPNDYGCFIGAVANNYYDNVACHPPNAYSMLGTSRAFFSGRISHQFGFTGPAMSIDTACSSSLVAVNAACRAIQSGECTRAIAGGTNVFTSPYDYQNLAAAGFLSPSGGCKPFDATADGYCRGEGVAAVVLKSLDKALEEGDDILGVIVGSAVNQNHNDAHITVPCSSSQTAAYEKALSMANASPKSVTYVEAHGTGTQVGDPIECQSIRQAFGSPDRDSKLYFGSVKGNIGHTEATAGVAGLIKVLLMMKHKTILSQAGYTSLNPKIPALEPDMMDIATACQPWEGKRRLACVNSYGAAGSNAVIAVREAPYSSKPTSGDKQPLAIPQPLFLSAASEGSLSNFASKLLAKLPALQQAVPDKQHLLSSLLFQLNRRANHELAFAATTTASSLDDLEQFLKALATSPAEKLLRRTAPGPARPVVLVFGGQEQAFVGLDPQVVRHSELLKLHLDECQVEAERYGVTELVAATYQTKDIAHLPTLHAALFAAQYATAKAWIDSGIQVEAVVGHSFGQLTELCVSGCLSLRDALRMVIGRAKIIDSYWGTERGAMISVQGDAQYVKGIISTLQAQDPNAVLDIACYNHAKGHVLVGTSAAVDAAEKILEADGSVRVKRLPVTHGFHSPLTEPLLPKINELASKLQWKKPSVHLELASVDEEQQPPGPWLVAELTRAPVFFASAIERLSKKHKDAIWLEAGPGSSVISLVKQNLTDADKDACIKSLLNTSKAVEYTSDTVMQLWKLGVPAQFWSYNQLQRGDFDRVDLPGYQFENTKHWLPFVEPVAPEPAAAAAPAVAEPAVEIKHEFISLLETAGDRATFFVDPESERFVHLLTGHTVAGQYLAPGSLYIELLSRATLMLTSGASYDTHVTHMDWMRVKGSPIGLDAKKNIFIQLTRVSPAADYWDYEISTKNKTGPEAFTVHTTGRVGLRRRDDQYLQQITQRWSALIGFDRAKRLIASEETEKMQGKHVYHALKGLADFDEMYQGIKSISYQGNEAAGRAAAKLDESLSPSEHLYDTPTIDGLMQFAGVIVNYFVHPSGKEILVCQGINEIVTGGSFDITLGEWVVYTVITEDTPERVVSDAYVFNPKTKQVVIAFMGFVFAKVATAVLNKSLHSANYGEVGMKPLPQATATYLPSAPAAPTPATTYMPPAPAAAPVAPVAPVQQVEVAKPTPAATPAPVASRKSTVYQILNSVTDVPLDEISDEVSLEDLGIDSLLVTEVLNELQSGLGITISVDEFLFLPNVGAVCKHIDSALGAEAAPAEAAAPAAASTGSKVSTAPAASNGASAGPPMPHAKSTFAKYKDAYSRAAVTTGATGFWEDVYPKEAALVLAYVVEAFRYLGVDVAKIANGGNVAVVPHLDRHKQLVRQFYRVLEDADLVTVDAQGGFVRTSTPVDPTPASKLAEKIIPAYPKHASVHKITQAVGCELGPCLIGEKDGLQIVFGNKENKKTLDDLYENWPLVRSGTLALGEYLEKLMQQSPPEGGKFRILEVGAGTGGTTKYIARHLQKLGIPFEYVFTDLSASLVAAAKRTFKDVPEMSFSTLDIEKEPKAEWVHNFHVILSTNCIHATRNLNVSLTSLRRMLRDDGVLTLVEITDNMFWLDIAVGLFEGWWLFEDGREHAVTHESRWERCMKESGFAAADWTDGPDKEAQTIRVIAGFASDD